MKRLIFLLFFIPIIGFSQDYKGYIDVDSIAFANTVNGNQTYAYDSNEVAMIRDSITKWVTINQLVDSIYYYIANHLRPTLTIDTILLDSLYSKYGQIDTFYLNGISFQDTVETLSKAIAADSNYFNLNGTTLTPKTATKIDIDTAILDSTYSAYAEIDTQHSDKIYFNTNYIKYLVDSLYYNAIGSHIFEINGTEKLRINSSGNLGIGTTNPNDLLEVSGDLGGNGITVSSSSGAGITLDRAANINNAHLKFSTSGTVFANFGSDNDGTNNLYWGNDATFSQKYLTLQEGGNVGIGTTAPDVTLELNETTGGTLRYTYNDADGSATTYTDTYVESDGDGVIDPTGDTTHIESTNLEIASGNVFYETSNELHLNTPVEFNVNRDMSVNASLLISGVTAMDNNDTDDTLLIGAGYDAVMTENADLVIESGGAIKFEAAKTYYYSINPSKFKPYDASGIITTDAYTGLDSIYVLNEADVIFKASIELPNGATITNIITYGNDVTETWEVRRQTGSTGATTQMATANINSNDNTITNATIDNSTYTYGIETSSFEGLTTDALYGTIITYTLSEL